MFVHFLDSEFLVIDSPSIHDLYSLIVHLYNCKEIIKLTCYCILYCRRNLLYVFILFFEVIILCIFFCYIIITAGYLDYGLLVQ